jgi:antitoxin component YwqK of YwqJK toxin-antitoxin module
MRSILLSACLALSLTFNAQVTDASGKKQGYWKKKDEKTNKLLYEGEFRDNKPVGKFKYYYANDSLQAIMHFREEGKIAYARLFHPNGKRMGEGKYINEIKDSVWTFYDEAGVKISKDRYVMGKKDGSCIVYFPDGTISEEKIYKMDVQHGPFKQYFDGKKVRGQGNYVDGNLDGRVAYYFPNGVEVAAGYYEKGSKVGPWIYKNQKGKITDKELYRNGKLASEKETKAFFEKNKVADTPVKETRPPGDKKPETKKPAPKSAGK